MQSRRSIMTLSVALAAIAVSAALLTLTAAAAPPGPILPTPTLAPVENVAHSLQTYGGSRSVMTFEHEAHDGFTLSRTRAVSAYPAGMLFGIQVESDAGDIENVTWVLRRERFRASAAAEWDPDLELWVAHPWAEGGQPIGTEGQFFWRVRDTVGNAIETEPQFVIYWDPDNEWFRMESDNVIVHWYGFSEDDPDVFAQMAANYMAALVPRWEAGFGRTLSYRPMAILYPNIEAMARMNINPVISATLGGFTRGGEGFTTQRMVDEPPPGARTQCSYINWDLLIPLEARMADALKTVGHEFTHLHQFEALGASAGPIWWSEGQAEWFANGTPEYADVRMRNIETTMDMPTLANDIGSQQREADGCNRLAYDAGGSFVNWFVATYGGIDAHRQVVELMRNRRSLFEALEEVTGKPFLDLENEWRAYNGLRAIQPEEINPALALEIYEDPLLAVGDTITLPALPAINNILKDPEPNGAVSGACWANSQVKILAMGQVGGVAYFQVDCMGQQGWMTRDQLVAPD